MEGYTRILKFSIQWIFYVNEIFPIQKMNSLVSLRQNEVFCLAIPPGPGIASLEKKTGYNFIVEFDIVIHVLEILYYFLYQK